MLEVRLVDGSTSAEGRVEVFYEGDWGTVCDDHWDINNADIVCKMMGYGGAIDAPCCAYFGEGSGNIILDNVQCSGTEENLGQCVHMDFEQHNCRHNEDAGVICYKNGRPTV